MIKDNSAWAILSDLQLRKIIPTHASLLDKRIQPTLDFFSSEYMNKACIAILGSSSHDIAMMPICYQSSFTIKDDTHIELDNLNFNNVINTNKQPCHASLFIIVPGIGHSLRINGELNIINNQQAIFNIKGVYFHCSRASVRSDFWKPRSINQQVNQQENLITEDNIISQSPYALLKTQNTIGKTEISPRGDDIGFIKVLNNTTLFMPERPGNKVAVSLRNIIECPAVELLFMVPGSVYTLNVKGQAYVSTQPELLSMSQINNKLPKTGIIIKVDSKQFQFNNSINHSGLWDEDKAVDKNSLTSFSKALSSHMNGIGLMGMATSAVVAGIVKHDLKNLY
ncbi:MAG: putative pyridoxine 5'-phosphate oxidase superfamily flavin-nucleotide-binding protein [Bermanella sp.]|jgi:predicted pyridoxine 5'-phosphate oxidase superfamily flavin-nucleotide-binding protein